MGKNKQKKHKVSEKKPYEQIDKLKAEEVQGFDSKSFLLLLLFLSACTFMFLVLYNFP